jgi:putative ABC transport system substrate-binding protein
MNPLYFNRKKPEKTNRRIWNLTIFFIFSLTTIIILASQLSQAKESHSILLIETMPVAAVLESTHWFREGLKDLGYVEGENIKLTILNLDGDKKNASSRVDALLREIKPDLVVTNATLASQVAYKLLRGTQTPLLFFTVGAPVKAGLVDAVGVPSGQNITGKVKMLPSEIRLTIVSRLLSGRPSQRPLRFGYIYPSYPSSISDLKSLSEQDSAHNFVSYMVESKKVPEGTQEMLSETIEGIKQLEDKADFWWESAGPLGEMPEYTEALLKYSDKPIVFGHRMDSVKQGALVSLVVSLEANGRETAQLADSILKGQPPGEITVSPVTTFNLGINLKTALDMGIVVPKDILELAKEYVYH